MTWGRRGMGQGLDKAEDRGPQSRSPQSRGSGSKGQVQGRPGTGAAWQSLALEPRARPGAGASGVAAEQEADRVAGSLLGGSPAESSGQGAALRASGPSRHPQAAGLGQGEPLAPAARAVIEPRLGLDLGGVRIHTGERAQAAARGLGARAFAAGPDLAFAPGEYDPSSQTGQRLLTHELTHVAQQAGSGPALQRQDAPQGPAPGTTADLVGFVTHPAEEPDATLKAAMALWDSYAAKVKVSAVDFRLLAETDRESAFGDEHRIGGRSFWDKKTPVIELPQVVLDDVAEYLRVRGTPAASVGDTETPGSSEAAAAVRKERAPLERAHEAVRVIGHELYHLWREKEGNSDNPLQAPFDKEAKARMAKVRDNWVAYLKDLPAASLRAEGIPAGTVIKKWTDIPEAVRTSIEEGAAKTDYIAGLYQRSAYLVEEIYTKVEELSYLRVQQRDRTAAVYEPSKSEVSGLATLVNYLHNVLRSMADPDGLITPDLLAKTETAILKHLRDRFKSTAGADYDAYEVVFYLSAIRNGVPPHYSGDKLISNVPGARLPP